MLIETELLNSICLFHDLKIREISKTLFTKTHLFFAKPTVCYIYLCICVVYIVCMLVHHRFSPAYNHN